MRTENLKLQTSNSPRPRAIARCPRQGCGEPVENGRCTNPKCGYALPEAHVIKTTDHQGKAIA